MSALLPLTRKIRVKVIKQSSTLFEHVFDHYPITFGRSKRASIPLEFDFISRSHGVITEENGKIFIIDLQSSNGISVDGKKVAKAEIKAGLEVKVGELIFHVEVLSEQKSKDTATSPSRKVTVDTAVTLVGQFGNRGTETITEKISEKDRKELKGHVQSALPQKPAGRSAKPPALSAQQKQPPPQSAANSDGAAGIFLTEYHRQNHRPPKKTDHHNPLVDYDFSADLLGHHPQVSKSKDKRIEAIVTWHDQIYDIKEFWPGETIVCGPLGTARLIVPTLAYPIVLGNYIGQELKCYIPKTATCVVEKDHTPKQLSDLVSSGQAVKTDKGCSLVCKLDEIVRIDLGSQVRVHLRFIPGSPEIPGATLFEADESLRTSITTSLIMHGALALMMILNSPDDSNAPILKNVPQRYAKLLVEKPKPKPTPPAPAPKPTPPKEIVKKKEPPKEKKVAKVIPKVFKIPKVIAKRNKFPMEVKNPVPKAPPPVKLENLGALAALGQISKTAPKNVVTNININPNAGGLPTKVNTGGIVSALPSSNGKLIAAGGGPVKTKGAGYGTGTGYGIQGLKGSAGGRGVAGAIVGRPQLAKATRAGEGLTRDQVMAVVKKHLGEIQHCYEKNLISTPSLKGRMEFEWDIEAPGRVSAVRIKRSTVDSGDGLGECVKSIFSSMVFPRAKNGQGTTPTIGFPFGTL